MQHWYIVHNCIFMCSTYFTANSCSLMSSIKYLQWFWAVYSVFHGYSVCFIAACSPLVGTKECSWGPAYWCSHAKNAKACGAVQHCLDTVWSKQTIAENSQVFHQLNNVLIHDRWNLSLWCFHTCIGNQ